MVTNCEAGNAFGPFDQDRITETLGMDRLNFVCQVESWIDRLTDFPARDQAWRLAALVNVLNRDHPAAVRPTDAVRT